MNSTPDHPERANRPSNSALESLERLSSRAIRLRRARAREREARARVAAVRASREREIVHRDRVVARLAVEKHPAVRMRLLERLQAVDALIEDLEVLEVARTTDWAVERSRSASGDR